jgi:fatty acid desaturase
MRLRHRADVRALVWAFVLFPLVPAIGYADPQLAPWLLPIGLYLAYCAGILTHNHNHCPVFEGRGSNKLYGAWLSLFYGHPIFAWVPTHNQNHHRYLNGPGDATRTTRFSENDSLLHALAYPLLSSLWQMPGIRAYVAWARVKQPSRFREIVTQYAVVIGGHATLAWLAVAVYGAPLGIRTYAFAIGIPALFSNASMMFTNYLQHVGCNPTSQNDHSRNFVSPLQNWFAFDAGYHTVHHEKPGVHWSEYRRLHEARASAIDPELNEHSILGFCVKRYVLGPLRRTARRAAPTPH